MSSAQRKYRLTGIAQIDGTVREAGYEFTLPGGVRGPYVTRQISCDLHASSIDAVMDGKFDGQFGARFVDIPIYEEIPERVMIALPAPIPPDIAEPVASDPADPRLREMLALVDKLGEQEV